MYSIMKNRILLLLVTFISLQLSAQNLLTGKVFNVDDNTPLPGATLFIPDLNRGTVTDEKGLFILKDLPHRDLQIVVSYVGFETLLKEVNASEFKKKQLILKLKPSVIKAQEVVITGGSSTSQHENAIKIDVIKKSDLLLSGTPNLMESLSSVPGVDMISKGTGVSKPLIRGLSMNDVLVLNDGVRIENYQFSENHPLGVDDNNLNKVEVVKGPASMLYGSDAIGGVLNFVKAGPAPVGKIEGEYTAGLYANTEGFTNALNIKGAGKHLFGGAGVNRKSHADYKQGGGDFTPNSRFNEWSANANIGYSGKVGSFKLDYDYFGQKLGMCVPAVRSLITERGHKNKIWYQDLDHHQLSSKNILLLGRFKWETNVAFQAAYRKLRTTVEEPTVQMRLNTLTYESKLYLPSERNSEYLVALQGMNQTNRNQHHRVSEFLPDADVNTLGGLFLAQHTFFSKLKLQAGIRYDTYHTKSKSMGDEGASTYHAPVSRNFHTFNGSVGMTYSLTDNILIRSNLAKAYRVPNLSELTSNGLHGNRYEYGNNNLDPENAYEADLSLHYHSTYLSVDVAGFYNHINNYIYISPTGEQNTDGIAIYQFSQTNAHLYGGELAFEYRPSFLQWLSVKGSYSSVTGKENGGNYLPFIPANKVKGKLVASFNKWGVFRRPSIWLGITSAFRQSHPSLYETETAGYTLFDAGMNVQIKSFYKEMNLALLATNIFDRKYIDHLSTLKTLGYYNPGRNICLMLTIPFGK